MIGFKDSLRPLAGLLALLCVSTASSADVPVRCGAILPLTGPLSAVGLSIRRAVELALEKQPQASQVEFIFEDDAFTPRQSVSAATKLISVDKVQCLLTFGSTTSLAIGDLAERYKVPTISIAISPKVSQGKHYILKHYADPEALAAAATHEIERRGYQRIAAITTTQDAMLAIRDALTAKLPGRFVFDEQVLPGDTEVRGLVSRMLASKPDAVFLATLPPQTSALSRQLRGLNFSGKLFGAPPMGSSAEVAAAQGALFGAWFVSNNPAPVIAFQAKFRARYGEDPELEAIHGYDAALLFRNGLATRSLNSYLHAVDGFSGALGTYGVRDNSFQLPAGVWSICENGKFEAVGR